MQVKNRHREAGHSFRYFECNCSFLGVQERGQNREAQEQSREDPGPLLCGSVGGARTWRWMLSVTLRDAEEEKAGEGPD